MPMVAQKSPYTLFILDDDYAQNPQEDRDDFCAMSCWHSIYNLGDKHNYTDSAELFRELIDHRIPAQDIINFVKDGKADGVKCQPPYTKEQIAQANSVNLIDYAVMNGYNLETGGRRSLHAKQSGGLYFLKDKNRYYSFTADKSGDPIDFVMEYEGKNFLSAVEHLLSERPISLSKWIRITPTRVILILCRALQALYLR